MIGRPRPTSSTRPQVRHANPSLWGQANGAHPLATHIVTVVDAIDRRLTKHRNRLVHDPKYYGEWFDQPKRVEYKNVRAKGGIETERHVTISSRTIRLLNRAIRDAKHYFFEIYNAFDISDDGPVEVGKMARVERSRAEMFDALNRHEAALEADKRSK